MMTLVTKKVVAEVHGMADNRRRMVALVKYCAIPENTKKQEKCVSFRMSGFSSDDLSIDNIVSELAFDMDKSKYKKNELVSHWVLSWKGGTPNQEEIFQAGKELLADLGYTDFHKKTFAIHADTDNIHLHMCVCKVDPWTSKIVSEGGGWWKNESQKSQVKIAKNHGWQVEPGNRFQVHAMNSEQEIELSHSVSAKAAVFEHRHGVESDERRISEAMNKFVEKYKDDFKVWKTGNFHRALASELGIGCERITHGEAGFGLVFTPDGKTYFPASKVCPELTYPRFLEKIGGGWRDARRDVKNILSDVWEKKNEEEAAPLPTVKEAKKIRYTKEQLDLLRKIPPVAVFQKLDMHPMEKTRKNRAVKTSFDVLIGCAQMSYAESADWLAARFPEILEPPFEPETVSTGMQNLENQAEGKRKEAEKKREGEREEEARIQAQRGMMVKRNMIISFNSMIPKNPPISVDFTDWYNRRLPVVENGYAGFIQPSIDPAVITAQLEAVRRDKVYWRDFLDRTAREIATFMTALRVDKMNIYCAVPEQIKRLGILGLRLEAASLSDICGKLYILAAVNALGMQYSQNASLFCMPFYSPHDVGIMIDDVKLDFVGQYAPNVILHTSDRSQHAFYLLPRERFDPRFISAFMPYLNSKYGDPNIHSVSHGTRLPGFRNGKYDNFPWVRVGMTNPGYSTKFLSYVEKQQGYWLKHYANQAQAIDSKDIDKSEYASFRKVPVSPELRQAGLAIQKRLLDKWNIHANRSKIDYRTSEALIRNGFLNSDEVASFLFEHMLQRAGEPSAKGVITLRDEREQWRQAVRIVLKTMAANTIGSQSRWRKQQSARRKPQAPEIDFLAPARPHRHGSGGLRTMTEEQKNVESKINDSENNFAPDGYQR